MKGGLSMVIVEKDKCKGCGLCARICHEQCIQLIHLSSHKEIEINHSLCSTCTQCIAVCPRQALSWDGITPMVFENGRLPTFEQLDEMFKQRRTVREYKKTPIDRHVLEEIVQMGIYAPTNNYHLRAVVVDDPVKMNEFDAIIMRYVTRIYKLYFKRRFLFEFLKSITPLINEKQKVKLTRGLKRGSAYESIPAATIFIVGDARILESGTSAQYALYNMILYAQARGLGSRISAAGVITLDRNRAVRKYLNLQRHEHILGNLDLGYPAVRFRNKVEGKKMPIVWASNVWAGGDQHES